VRERSIFAIVIVSLLLLVIGYLAATQLNLMPAEASTRAVAVDSLFRAMVGTAAVIFVLVEGALVYAALRFRRRQGDDVDAKPTHGNTTLELVWTAVPAMIVVAIGFYAYQTLTEIEKPAPDPLVVEVIGRQFIWQFRYPENGITAQELHLPVNKPVRFEITSADVIHSFWVPQFRGKRDATPGRISEFVITPTKLGEFPVRCAELCGPGHANMTTKVIVQTQSEFDAWLMESQ
jgi:cytochrome c oxidase subunit 2